MEGIEESERHDAGQGAAGSSLLEHPADRQREGAGWGAVTRRGVYLAGPDGFSAAGQLWHDRVLVPALTRAGLVPLDPWDPSDAASAMEKALAMPEGPERVAALHEADMAAGAHNADLLDRADGVLAVLDGTDVDSGTAAEVGYACARGKVVVGIRTDSRLAGDNAGCRVNLQVEYFVEASGGLIVRDVGAAVAYLAGRLG